MRQATAEQKAAAAERRSKMRAIAKTISDLDAAQRASLAARSNIVTIEGRALSVFNQCFAATQNPTATVVGGFRQWLAAGRAVRKGEHGIAIWVPCKRKDADGQEGEADETRFILGTVFDVSQTIEVETGTKHSEFFQSQDKAQAQYHRETRDRAPEYSEEFTPIA